MCSVTSRDAEFREVTEREQDEVNERVHDRYSMVFHYILVKKYRKNIVQSSLAQNSVACRPTWSALKEVNVPSIFFRADHVGRQATEFRGSANHGNPWLGNHGIPWVGNHGIS